MYIECIIREWKIEDDASIFYEKQMDKHVHLSIFNLLFLILPRLRGSINNSVASFNYLADFV